ncbi:MAG TPA: hypothetical protein VFA77_11125 [Candidatus Eisenbacteria bacterium]|nr:hypothetical protein [Candidatus Eisenbacteria bacterium]
MEEFLRAALKKKRPEDRMKIFREWRRSCLRKILNREPTDQELEDEIKMIRETKFGDPYQAEDWAYLLRDFVPVFHKENRIKKARLAATKRHSKKK